MRRWIIALAVAAAVSVAVPAWVTLYLVMDTVDGIEERRESEEEARAEQIEAIRGQGECILRLLLVPTDAREGFTVSRILDSCPDALPEREQGEPDRDEFETGNYPGSRQPWEVGP